jgi:methyl-accepting chemotaxis protein
VKIVAMVIIIVSVLTAALFVANYRALAATLDAATGASLERSGEQAAQRASEVIGGSVKALKALALSPEVVALAETANAARDNRNPTELAQDISRQDDAWKAEAEAASALVAQIEGSTTSDYLRSFQAAFPENVEVFLTDARGLNLAMTGRTGDYLQADEDWWQATYNEGRGGVYIGEVSYDDSSQSWALDIGVPIQTPAGAVVGVMRGTVDISVIFASLAQIQIGETGRAALLDRQGNILYAEDASLHMQPVVPELMALAAARQSGWQRGLPDLDGHPALLGYYFPADGLSGDLGWGFLLDQDLAEIDGQLRQALLSSLWVALVVCVLMLLIGFWVAQRVARPLVIVTQRARRMAEGDLFDDGRARLGHRLDEVGALAASFEALSGYLTATAARLEQLAGGDLTVQITPRGPQDVLARAFQQMQSQLHAAVSQVAANSQQLQAAAGQLAENSSQAGQATSQIAATVQQVAAGASQQAASISRTAFSVEQMARAIEGVTQGAQEQAQAVAQAAHFTSEMSGAIEQVAASAATVRQQAEQAAGAARGGAQTMSATVAGMGRIRAKVGLSADKVREMGTRSAEITAIVETIDDLASQTNLLALNAAIEAARAGEHGKGFAVVADEVRKLAEKSALSARQIGALVAGIQASVGEAVSAMQAGVAEVESGAAGVNAAGEALTQILALVEAVNQQAEQSGQAAVHMNAASGQLVTAMDSVSAVVEQNTAATEEMAAGSSEVTQTIENIASISEQNSAAIEEVSAGAEEMTAQVEEVGAAAQTLAEMARQLQQVVALFTLAAAETPQADRVAPVLV